MITKIKLSLIIPDYENLEESEKDKKYVCKCEVCDKGFECSFYDAEVCRKCAFKYFLF